MLEPNLRSIVMKKKSAFLALAFAIASPTAALEFPGVDTCTAAIAGHAVAVYNYNQRKSAYPPQPCYSE